MNPMPETWRIFRTTYGLKYGLKFWGAAEGSPLQNNDFRLGQGDSEDEDFIGMSSDLNEQQIPPLRYASSE
jgi:hypothetical protein